MRTCSTWALFTILLAAVPATCQHPHLKMALTIDDLPQHDDLPPGVTRIQIAQSMAATLKAFHMPPTYGFLNAAEVAGNPELEPALKIWVDGGQLLGNHTFTHPDLNTISAAAFEAEIAANEPMLKKYMPDAATQDYHWFRYPYLHEGDTLRKRRAIRHYLAENHYKIAEVNNDFEDYLWNEPFARCMTKGDTLAVKRLHDSYLAAADADITVFRTLSHRVLGRDVSYILLLHEGAFDAHMLPELLDLYRRKGFTFISLQEAEKDRAYRTNPDQADPGGGTLLEQVAALRNIGIPANPKPTRMLKDICR